MNTVLITGGHVVDPKNKVDEVCDVLVEDGVIAQVAKNIEAAADTTIDARGLHVTPGLIDLQVHVREPGREDRETIETASRAALKGGVTSIVAMPNSTPAADNQSVIEFVRNRAKEVGLVHVFPAGAITKSQSGNRLAEMYELKQSGAVAVTDDGFDVQDEGLLRRAMEYAKTHDILLMSHCETATLTDGGVMHEGWVSTQLGLPGTPAVSEDLAVQKNLLLAKDTGARLHLLHNSTEGAVDAIRTAKAEGKTNVSAEVSIQHATLTDEECLGYNTNAKMYPPLRSQAHVTAVIEAIKDGTIDALTTDHAPHIEPDKLLPFQDAAMGSVGLETLFAAGYTYLVQPGHITLRHLVALLTHQPADIIQQSFGTLGVGTRADISVFDLSHTWTVDSAQLQSKGKNCVYKGKELAGKVVHVLVSGRVKVLEGDIV